MIRGKIIYSMVPAEAAPGTRVSVDLQVQNQGDQLGLIIGAIWMADRGADVYTYSPWEWMRPGQAWIWRLDFTMPPHAVVIYGYAWSHDPVTQVQTCDEESMIGVVAVQGQGPPAPPDPVIQSASCPLTVKAGSKGTYSAVIANEGGLWAPVTLMIWYFVGSSRVDSYSDTKQLSPGQVQQFSADFTMPGDTITLYACGQYWDFNTERFAWGPTAPGVTVRVVSEEARTFDIPGWLRDFLDGLGWHRGQWFTVPIINAACPPFDFMVGDWILAGLDAVLDGVNWTIDAVTSVWDTANNAWDLAVEAWNNADGLIQGIGGVIDAWVGTWWDAVYEGVKGFVVDRMDVVVDWAEDNFRPLYELMTFVYELDLSWDGILSFVAGNLGNIEPFRTVFDTINTVIIFMDDVGNEAWAFFAGPVDWIFDKIEGWLDEEVTPD